MSTYLEKLDYLEETKDLIKNAIESKGVSVSSTDTFRDYADKIGEISGGGSTPEIPRGTPLTRDDFPLSNAVKERRIAKPFTFYDYDGTVLGQYTKAQIDAMTSEDDFPTPIGNNCGDGIDEYPLTFVGWNWTLEELKGQPYGINVGAIYAHMLDDGTQSPVSVFMNITEETTFKMGNSSTINVSTLVDIYNRATGEKVLSDNKLNTEKTITLPIGKYVVMAKSSNNGDVLTDYLFKDSAALKYIEGICIGDRYRPGNSSVPFVNSITEVKFLCNNVVIYSGYPLVLSLLVCNHFNDARGTNNRTHTTRPCNCKTISYNTASVRFDEASLLEELLIPTNYTITPSVQLDKSQNLKEIYIPGEFSGNYPYGIEAIYMEDNSKITANLVNCDFEELYIPDYRTPYEILLWYFPYGLKKLRLPSNTTKITGSTNSEIRHLESIYLPDSLTTIGEFSFKNCRKLKTLYVPDSVQTIDKEAFAGTMLAQENLRLPENVKISPTGVFANTPIKKPWKDFELTGTTNYGLYPGCYYLEGELVVPETITSLNNGLTGAGANDFIAKGLANSCQNITKVVLPNSITEIPNYSFSGCISLEEVNIPINTTKINQYAFQYCKNLKEITLPETLTTLSSSCFGYCTSLKKVILPDSLTSLGSGYTNNAVFEYCKGLEEITLSNNLKSLGANTFNNCTSLKSITIPASVSDMNGGSMFASCNSLMEVHMKPTTPPTLNSSTFGNGATLPAGANARIYVPYSEDHSILEAYKAATNWSKYATYIVEEPQE